MSNPTPGHLSLQEGQSFTVTVRDGRIVAESEAGVATFPPGTPVLVGHLDPEEAQLFAERARAGIADEPAPFSQLGRVHEVIQDALR